MNSVWIILLSSVLTVYASPACDLDEALKKCDMGTGDGNFPVDAIELKKACSIEKKTFSCQAEFLERCPGIVKKGYYDFYVVADLLLNRVCDGDLRDKYLRNVKCFRDVITDKQNFCGQKYMDVNRDFSEPFTSVEDCIASFIKDICGKEAFEVVSEVYKVTSLIKDL